MMLDEVDKLGAGGFHGDPASALLEVLDPEQNSTFRDNYLAVPFDLSKVMFICTANVLDTIPGPLRDRMEVIQLPGYTDAGEAADRAPLPRAAPARGDRPARRAVRDHRRRAEAIIDDYTREAGVRNLEREIGSVCRHVAVRIAEGSVERMTIGAADLHAILGAEALRGRGRDAHRHPRRRDRPGVDAGGRRHPLHRGGAHAGQRPADPHRPARRRDEGERAGGAVARQGARARCSASRPESLDKADIHVHVPAGATPKDGPSAGVAMFVALTSLLTDRPVRSDVAMTGEISLRGLVLPIGGVKEKVLAALRAGITTVMLPARNRRDLEDIPADARAQLRFVWLERVDDALRVALEPAASAPRADADGDGERLRNHRAVVPRAASTEDGHGGCLTGHPESFPRSIP